MATTVQKITLSSSRDIPFNKLVLSQSNVRRVKAGVSIEELAEDIARRTLLQSLSVRPVLDAEGAETGMFEVPAGGRRYRALQHLVKQKRLAKTAPVPCVVRDPSVDISAEEDSLAENIQRAPLHPLDQFRAFQALREKGQSEEDIAAAFFVGVNVVKQRLRLAAVSGTLLDVYAEDGISLDQLMAFTVTNDHARQEQVWETLQRSYGQEPYQIRRMLTERSVRASDIRDLVEAEHPVTLYLVVPPSDISRTKPLIRLILNQIGRRLTEELESKRRRHRLLLMLDEFPALGRLDFFESALAFMAGYGLKSFLIAQSLNQIEKAYGQNNSILDNCHVRVSFATNDERTAKRVSDALGTATEMRAMKNYAGSRLSPWLGHLMVSRQETARPLLTPGEVMQLPPDEELVLMSGCAPIRAKKARYFEDPEMTARILPPPALTDRKSSPSDEPSAVSPDGDWGGTVVPPAAPETEDPANAGIRREPELPEHEEIVPEPAKPAHEFEPMDEEPDDEAQRQRIMQRTFGTVARQVSLDPGDDMQM